MRKRFDLMAVMVMVCFLFLAFTPVMQTTPVAEGVDTDKFCYKLGEPVIITYHTMIHCVAGDIIITNVWRQEIVYEPNPWVLAPCYMGPYDGKVEWDQTYQTYYISMHPSGDEHNGQQVPPGLYMVEAGNAKAYFFILPVQTNREPISLQ